MIKKNSITNIYYIIGILIFIPCLILILNHSRTCLSLSLKNSHATSIELKNINKNTINNFDLTSPTNKLLLINTKEQKLYVFKGYSRNWNLEKDFICATGLPGTETPTGTFSCNFRGEWFFSNKFNMGAKYYINFNDCYYIHSVPLYADRNTVAEYTLGCPASHGCVRLSVEDSKWLYENVTDNSTIIIP